MDNRQQRSVVSLWMHIEMCIDMHWSLDDVGLMESYYGGLCVVGQK